MENLIRIFGLPSMDSKQQLLDYIKENYQKLGRKKLTVKIYKEKKADGNPYYSFMGYLNDCTNAAKEVIDINLPCQNTAKEQQVIGLSEDEDIKFLMKNNLIFIDRAVGGHRSKCVNDNEIYLSIYTKPLCDIDALEKNIYATCAKNTAMAQIEIKE